MMGLNRFPLALVLAPSREFWNFLDNTQDNLTAEPISKLIQLPATEAPQAERLLESGKRHTALPHRGPGLAPPPPPSPGWGGAGRGRDTALPSTFTRVYSTFQMAIFPSPLPDPLSTYLSSAEHRVFTVSTWATSSFSTVFLSASIT